MSRTAELQQEEKEHTPPFLDAPERDHDATSKLLREQYVSKYTPTCSALSIAKHRGNRRFCPFRFHYSEGAICRITDFTLAAYSEFEL
jgi:hypothetical protein